MAIKPKSTIKIAPILESLATAFTAALIVGALGGPMLMWQAPTRARAPAATSDAGMIVAVAPAPVGAPPVPPSAGLSLAPARVPAQTRVTAGSGGPPVRAAAGPGAPDSPNAAPAAAAIAPQIATAEDELTAAHSGEQVLTAIKRSRDAMSTAERAQWIDQAAQLADRRSEVEPLLLAELKTKGAAPADEPAAGGTEQAEPGVGTSAGTSQGSDRYVLQAHAHQSLMALSEDVDHAMAVTADAMNENADSPVLVDLVYRQFLRRFPTKEAELKGKLSGSGAAPESTDHLVSGNL